MAGLLTTTHAAARLGVSTRHVRNLVASGELTQVARGVLDATSVDRYDAVGPHRTQAWAPTTAWAAVALLSGFAAPWLGTSQTSRLRSRLLQVTPEGLVERARARAVVTTYAAHRAALPRIVQDLVTPSRAGLGLAAATGTADGYLDVVDVERLVRSYALRADPDGVVTIRATTLDVDLVRVLAGRPVLAALDLAASLDPRERAAGLGALRAALEGLRR